MTYIEFKEKYNGKFVDYDGQYGSQCQLGFGANVFYRGS
jgi:hypothetical protein